MGAIPELFMLIHILQAHTSLESLVTHVWNLPVEFNYGTPLFNKKYECYSVCHGRDIPRVPQMSTCVLVDMAVVNPDNCCSAVHTFQLSCAYSGYTSSQIKVEWFDR